ncbi:MAG: bifunctional tetrahydrofolate synthase/dihydrofolate synthase [Gammaproteobacteria bacterium]
MQTPHNLAEWLSYLEQLHPRTIELGLQRISAVAQKLSLKSFPHPVITVAGTNGKGSCVCFLETILRNAGYRVGAYTSPHLLHFNERIRINSQEIDDASLCVALQKIESARGDIPLTFFEFTTLAALLIFQHAQLDALILEVGLGGRLDAVNIIDADVAVITTIDLDHMDWLGQDRETIGCEKAGILRSNKPAVFGDTTPVNSIQQIADQLSSKLYCLNRDFYYEPIANGWHWYSPQQTWRNLPQPHLEIQNAASALMALSLLQNQLPVSETAIHQGLRQAKLAGRWQRLPLPITCIADVAHNPHAARWVAKRLKQEPCTGRTLAVVGMLADKDIKNTLATLADAVDTWYVGSLSVARGASAQTLTAILALLTDKICYNCSSIELALQQAINACETSDRILIFGSFHTVEAGLKLLETQTN